METRQFILSSARPQRLVIKIGTSLLYDRQSSDSLDHTMLDKLCAEIRELKKAGCQVMLVSSGAVRLGAENLDKKYNIKPNVEPSLHQRQALSALGQNKLITAYEKKFTGHKIPVAQLLLTARDFQDRRTYLNIQHTLNELLQLGALPIINENDTTAIDELQFGENDLLSSACAALFHAEYLLILTSVAGFFLHQERLSSIDQITQQHWQAAKGASGLGRGGMHAKLRAAELSIRSGIHCAILPGKADMPVSAFLKGKDIGTVFKAQKQRPLSARKKWILFAYVRGTVVVDAGASHALCEKGSSLLPVGVRHLRGHFLSNEIIEIADESGTIVGRGITNYSYREVLAMIGLNVQQLRERNLLVRGSALIHRNNLIRA